MKLTKLTAGLALLFIGCAGVSHAQNLIAYNLATAPTGNYNTTGEMGLDFTVNSAITVTQIGVFDSKGNGFTTATLTAQIYKLNSLGGTTGSLVAGTTATFSSASPGTIEPTGGGNKFKDLGTPITLAPGNYTIVAYGFTAADPAGNAQIGGFTPDTFNGSGGVITQSGFSRFGSSTGVLPTGISASNLKYTAGTFAYLQTPEPGAFTAAASMLMVGMGFGFRRRRRS